MKPLAVLPVLAICVLPAYAMDDLRITVQGTNAILSWPSAGYEAFVVRYRPDLQPGSSWVTLTNNYPATSGTNRTSFTHRGGVIPPVPCGGGGGGGSGGPPPPGGASLMRVPGIDGTVDATTEPTAYVDGATTTRMRAAIRTETKDNPWPPLPPPLWETLSPEERAHQEAMAAEAEAIALASGSPQSPQSDGPDGPSCGVSTGFYEVFLVPDTWFDYTQYQFTDSPEFIPVYLEATP